MNHALVNPLTDVERRFVAETSSDVLAGLDEEQVLELHGRARRMRNKYVRSYRRAAAPAVASRGGRGLSYAKNQRARGKAEIFETALARVSRRLARLASQSAAELKQERLAAARSGGSGRTATSASLPSRQPASRPRGAKKTTGGKTTGGLQKDASSRSRGARRQARRDAR